MGGGLKTSSSSSFTAAATTTIPIPTISTLKNREDSGKANMENSTPPPDSACFSAVPPLQQQPSASEDDEEDSVDSKPLLHNQSSNKSIVTQDESIILTNTLVSRTSRVEEDALVTTGRRKCDPNEEEEEECDQKQTVMKWPCSNCHTMVLVVDEGERLQTRCPTCHGIQVRIKRHEDADQRDRMKPILGWVERVMSPATTILGTSAVRDNDDEGLEDFAPVRTVNVDKEKEKELLLEADDELLDDLDVSLMGVTAVEQAAGSGEFVRKDNVVVDEVDENNELRPDDPVAAFLSASPLPTLIAADTSKDQDDTHDYADLKQEQFYSPSKRKSPPHEPAAAKRRKSNSPAIVPSTA